MKSRMLLFLVAALATSAVHADSSATDVVLAALNEKIDMKDFSHSPLTFKETLGLLHEKLAARGIEVAILVDKVAFHAEAPDAPDIHDASVHYAHNPRQLSLANALRLALGQLPQKSSYVVRQGMIVIMPQTHAEVGHLLRTRVPATFHRHPLGQALDDIADYTGISVVIDRRVEEAMKTPVTVRFRGNVIAEDALRLLTQAADLRIVILPSAVFVTTPATAVEMNEELANRIAETDAAPLVP